MTETDSTRRAIDVLGDVLPRLIDEAGLRADSCVLHTRAGLMVMARVGIPAYALPVRAVIANAPYWMRTERGEKPTKETEQDWLADGAWSLDVGGRGERAPTSGEKGYNGHLVMAVTDKYIVDLSARQFNRPARGMTGFGPFVVEAEDFLAERTDHIAFHAGKFALPAGNAVTPKRLGQFIGKPNVVIYRHHDDLSFRRGGDWLRPRADDPWVTGTIDAILRAQSGGRIVSARESIADRAAREGAMGEAIGALGVSAREALAAARSVSNAFTRGQDVDARGHKAREAATDAVVDASTRPAKASPSLPATRSRN